MLDVYMLENKDGSDHGDLLLVDGLYVVNGCYECIQNPDGTISPKQNRTAKARFVMKAPSLNNDYNVVLQKAKGLLSKKSFRKKGSPNCQTVKWKNNKLFFTYEWEEETSQFDDHPSRVWRHGTEMYVRTNRVRVPIALKGDGELCEAFAQMMVDYFPDTEGFWVDEVKTKPLSTGDGAGAGSRSSSSPPQLGH